MTGALTLYALCSCLKNEYFTKVETLSDRKLLNIFERKSCALCMSHARRVQSCPGEVATSLPRYVYAFSHMKLFNSFRSDSLHFSKICIF